MEKLVLKIAKWLLGKFAPNYHVHKNPAKTYVANFPRTYDEIPTVWNSGPENTTISTGNFSDGGHK